ncbi:hypothetical protein I5535_05215 [Rhodobacteraceae bacterium F11138]|nr:hypothetical protein [Rhodobacteraceae bacterium F11138]
MNIATTQNHEQRVSVDPPKDENTKAPAPATLTDSDLDRIRSHLGQGLGGYARQGDIVELHQRIGEKFEKLPLELGASDEARAAEQRAGFENLQSTLNSLEGALRIELAPLLQKSITESLQTAQTKRRSGWKGIVLVLAALCVGTAIGAIFQDTVLALISQAGNAVARIGAYLNL